MCGSMVDIQCAAADPSSRFDTMDMGQKVGAAVPLFVEGELGPHLTQCRLGLGHTSVYQVAFLGDRL